MDNKVVCYYCGTIYDEQEGKCPLCGGTSLAEKEEAYRPAPRRRITEQERRQRRRAASKGGKFSANQQKSRTKKSPRNDNQNTKSMLIAALVFLSLAVIVVTWFIGDMIGWWGGIENTVDRNETTLAFDSDESCKYLELSDSRIVLPNVGDQAELKISINANCREEVKITFPDAAIVTSVSEAPSVSEDGSKTDTWVLTAAGEGSARMSFICGEHSAYCDIIVGEAEIIVPNESEPDSVPDETEEPTEPDEDYEPELNFSGDISLYQRGESVPLRVMNLPQGAVVNWSSADETIAKIDENGILTAVSGGSTTVTAEVYGKTVEILVRCPFDQSGNIGAHLEYEDVTISVGESYYLYLLDSDGYRITDVTYEMSDEGICSIEDGKVTGLVGGDYITITVTYNTQTFKCIVRVVW